MPISVPFVQYGPTATNRLWDRRRLGAVELPTGCRAVLPTHDPPTETADENPLPNRLAFSHAVEPRPPIARRAVSHDEETAQQGPAATPSRQAFVPALSSGAVCRPNDSANVSPTIVRCAMKWVVRSGRSFLKTLWPGRSSSISSQLDRERKIWWEIQRGWPPPEWGVIAA